MDGDGADVDPELAVRLRELLLVNRLCEEFPSLSPMQIRRELDEDPEQTLLQLLEIRGYLAVQRAYAAAIASGRLVDDLKPYEGSPYLLMVEQNVYDLKCGT